MFIRAPKRWLNRSVVAKSFPDCQFRFLGIAKIILKNECSSHRRMRLPTDRPKLQTLRGASTHRSGSKMMPAKPPNPIDTHVGARVRMRRVEVNMSQQILGG